MQTFTQRTPAQRERIIETRLRAIETGEWMEKLGLHEALGIGPPIGANFLLGESTQDVRNRAARSGIALPGQSSPSIDEMIRLKKLEREHGVVAMNFPISKRYGIAAPRGSNFAGWDLGDLIPYDFSQNVIAGAITINALVLGLFPGNGNAQLIGAPDDVGGTLGVASASRTAASGKQPFYAILSAWVLARAAGAVYTAAAGTTIQPQIHSAAATALQLLTVLTAAAYNVNGGTTFWTQLTLAAPADRTINKSSGAGAAQAGIVQAFFGDSLLATLVTTGALTIPPNTLAIIFEVA